MFSVLGAGGRVVDMASGDTCIEVRSIEVRYAGVVVGRSTKVRDWDTAGAFIGFAEPLPSGTSLVLRGDGVEQAARVVEVFESADPAVAGMQVKFVGAAEAARPAPKPAAAARRTWPPRPSPQSRRRPPPTAAAEQAAGRRSRTLRPSKRPTRRRPSGESRGDLRDEGDAGQSRADERTRQAGHRGGKRRRRRR